MAKQSTVSNEKIIAALLNSRSLAQAADATGISPRTLYDRMNTSSFKAAYSAAKSDLIRNAVADLNEQLTDAVETIADIMNDVDISPSTRLQAAKLLLDNAGRFADRLAAADNETATMGSDNYPFS